MPTGVYKRKPRGDKPQASTGKAAKAAKAIKKPAIKRAPRKKAATLSETHMAAMREQHARASRAATSSDGSLSAYVSDKAMVKDALEHFPNFRGEVVDAEVRGARWAIEVSPNVYGWLAIQAKARGVSPDVLLEELVMRHIQLGLS